MTALTVTADSQEALAQLRDLSHLQWYVVPLLGIVLWIYSHEIERRRWDIIAAGLAFLFVDVFNELVNSAVFHATGTAPLWAVNGSTAYEILIGWSIEIVFIFSILGMQFVKCLPGKEIRVFGVPNRWVAIVVSAVGSVAIEVVLNRAGLLEWHYGFWGTQWGIVSLVPIVVLGYGTFYYAAAKVFDLASDRRRWQVVGTLVAVDAVVALGLGIAGWL